MTNVQTLLPDAVRSAVKLYQEIQHTLTDVFDERVRQLTKWGEQRCSDGTDTKKYTALADAAKAETDAAHKDGTLTWRMILLEEVLEAFSEEDKNKLRKELVQTAAVCCAWIEDIDKTLEENHRAQIEARAVGVTKADVTS